MALWGEKTVFSEYVLQDKAIRAAAGECTAEEFRGILEQMYENEMADAFSKNVSCCEFLIELILSVLRKNDKLKAFYEVKRNVGITMGCTESGNYSLLISCLKNDDEAAEYFIKKAMSYSDIQRKHYFAHPLYFLMITRKYHLVPAVLKRTAQLCSREFMSDEDEIEEDTDLQFFGCNAEFITVSAAYFEDRELLSVLIDKGLSINDYMALQFLFEPKAFEFIISNFFDKLGFDKTVSIYGYVKERFSTEEILRLAIRLQHMSEEAFDCFVEELCPLKKTDRISSYLVELYYRGSSAALANKELELLRDSAEKKLTIAVSGANHMIYTYAEQIFTDCSITYDLTAVNYDGYFIHCGNKVLKDILNRNVIFASDFLIVFVKECLSRNQKKLTSLLIKKGYINKDNYDEVLEFVISNRCLNSLAVLSTAKNFRNADQ